MIQKSLILSIIVPVYNVEKYLRDCLDSLLMQDLSTDEYEIICVDDGSKDSSPAILDEYAENHANIRVIHKQNGGVSSARNVGIEAAKGEYLWFVDSDDCIMPNCLGQLCQIAKEHHPQWIRFGWKTTNEGYSYKDEILPLSKIEYTLYDYLPTDMVAVIYSVCMAFINHELVMNHAIRFRQDMKYGEDTLFIFEICMHLTTRWVMTPCQVYCYRQVSTSATHTQTQESIDQRYQDRLRSIEVISAYQKKIYPNNHPLVQYAYVVKYKALHYFPLTSVAYAQGIEELKAVGVLPLKINWRYVTEQKTVKEKLGVLRNAVMFRFIPLYKAFYNRQRKRQGNTVV